MSLLLNAPELQDTLLSWWQEELLREHYRQAHKALLDIGIRLQGERLRRSEREPTEREVFRSFTSQKLGGSRWQRSAR